MLSKINLANAICTSIGRFMFLYKRKREISWIVLCHAKQERQSTYNVILRRDRANCCCDGETIRIIYSDFLFVALGIQHALHMHLTLQNYSTLSHKRHDFWKKNLLNANFVLISSINFPWNISHDMKNWVRYDKKNIYIGLLVKFPL